MRRKKRDASRGSPRSFAAQQTLAQDDNHIAPLPRFPLVDRNAAVKQVAGVAVRIAERDAK